MKTHQLGEEGPREQEVGDREGWEIDHIPTPPQDTEGRVAAAVVAGSEIKAISSDSRKLVLQHGPQRYSERPSSMVFRPWSTAVSGIPTLARVAKWGYQS